MYCPIADYLLHTCHLFNPKLSPISLDLSFVSAPKVFLKQEQPKNVYLKGPSFLNKYAASNKGQQQFCGLTRGGKIEFKRLVKLCNKARAKPETLQFEKAFLKNYQDRNEIIATSAEENKKANRRKVNDEIAQETDDEEEEDDEGDGGSLSDNGAESSTGDANDDDEEDSEGHQENDEDDDGDDDDDDE